MPLQGEFAPVPADRVFRRDERTRIIQQGKEEVMRFGTMMTVAVCLVVLAMSACPAWASFVAFGSLADPAGDVMAGAPDFASLSIAVDSEGMAWVTAGFAPGTFAADSAFVVSFDVDQDSSTGWAGTDSAHTDAGLIGVDYILDVYGSGFQGNATLLSFVGGWAFVSTCPVTYLANGCEVMVALANLGGDDGLLNFCAAAQWQYTDSTFSGITDYIPGNGLAVGSTVPEPGMLSLLALGGASLWRRRQ